MELPVADWQDYAHRKWLQISSHEKGQFSPESDLKESFDACWSLLQQEEEEILERLCSDLSVGKEPRAVLFFKEEGNKRFGRKQYTAAAVLYSKAISHGAPGTEEIAVCFANRSAVLFHLGHYSSRKPATTRIYGRVWHKFLSSSDGWTSLVALSWTLEKPITGDWAAAARHLRKSIQFVSQRYGSSSIELGHELFKLAQVLFNGREVDDAMAIILRAWDILSVHYGPDNSMVQELQEMRTCLLELPGMRNVWEK
ncbi:SET and MYND domain-containing protein 4 [Anomaloglossus baeobatrachus]